MPPDNSVRHNSAATAEKNSPRSCMECRRLKRKCNRENPCSACVRFGKQCSYAHPLRSSLTASRLVQAEQSIQDLQQLLQLHAPHLDVKERLYTMHQRSSSPSTAPEPVAGPSSQQSPPFQPQRLYETTDKHLPSWPEPPSTPFSIGPSSYSPASSSTIAPPLSSITPARALPPPSILPEKQPKAANGYDWNERGKSNSMLGDGTASLSVEPDGEGYLGFASGATLLRILQFCAGGLSLPQASADQLMSGTKTPNYEPQTEHISLFIESYFKFYHTQYPLLHEATFRAQWSEVVARPPTKDWDVLFNTVVALGAFCSKPEALHICDYFMDLATCRVGVQHLESGSLTLVQGFTLLSNLTQKRNKCNAGSVYLGIAVRMAIGLGLHRELPLWDISPFEREVRRRVWWVLFCFDSGACITFGRSILLPSDADISVVTNINDRALTPASRTAPKGVDEASIYTSLIFQSSLHTVGNRCYSRINASPAPHAEELLGLIAELDTWHRNIPSWFNHTVSLQNPNPFHNFAVAKLFWRYCNLRIIILRRPFLDRALKRQRLHFPIEESEFHLSPMEVAERRCVRSCLESAKESIGSILDYFRQNQGNPLEWWYGLHFLFQASFVPLLALHTDPHSPASESWQQDVATACSVLQLKAGDPLADRCWHIIHRLTPPASRNLGGDSLMNMDQQSGNSTQQVQFDDNLDIMQSIFGDQWSGLDWTVFAQDYQNS